MSILAKRFPRVRFTRALTAICERLDAAHTRTFDFKPPKSRFMGRGGRVCATVNALYAFGSWARGALECGDLDLAADISWTWADAEHPDGPPVNGRVHMFFDDVRKPMLGSYPHVEVHDYEQMVTHFKAGTSTVDPTALLPIWISPAMHDEVAKRLGSDLPGWQVLVAAVRPDPHAARAPRATDVLPLRLKQTSMDLNQAEKAVKAQQLGLIAWDFRHHGAIRLESLNLNPSERSLARELERDCSDERLVARAIGCTRDVRALHGARNVTYWFGAAGIWATMLDDRDASAIVITPRWSQAGPNGSLVLTAGPNYTLAKAEAFERDHR